jgi:hypothetical protein
MPAINKIRLCFDFTQSGTPGCEKEGTKEAFRSFGKTRTEVSYPHMKIKLCKSCYEKRKKEHLKGIYYRPDTGYWCYAENEYYKGHFKEQADALKHKIWYLQNK